MSPGKHPKTQRPSDRDLRGDPGIGRSKGMSKADPMDIEGDNTFEGDVENDPDDHDRSISPERRPRANK